jgi:cytochrome c biogenesis protein CcmG/thiol:disulfide interchange protein DsbE
VKEQKNSKKKNEPNTPKGLTKKQRGRIYTAAFLVLIAIFYFVNNSQNEPKRGPYPPHYKPQTASQNTEMLKLSDYRGKVVVVDFWATWCPPCRKGIPDLIELKKKYGDKDFEIIGISLDKISRGGKTAQDVVPFIKQYGINYPIVWGTMQTTQLFGGVRAIPTTFFIDKSGKIRDKIEGLASISTLENKIENLLKEKNLSPSSEGTIDFTLPVVK